MGAFSLDLAWLGIGVVLCALAIVPSSGAVELVNADEFSPALSTTDVQEYDIFTQYQMSRPEGPRSYYMYSPTSYSRSPSPLPLVMFYHGLTDICTQFISQFSVFALVAEIFQYHFAVMCGTFGSRGVGWNAGTCCLFPNSSSIPVDDVAYTRSAVAMIQSTVQVDKQRIFAMGHSNGAFFSEALACNASDVFRGIASNAGGTVLSPGNETGLALCDQNYGKNQTNILLIHGTGDTSVPWNGSVSIGLPSVMRDFQAWANRSQCTGQPVETYKRGVAHNLVYAGTCSGGSSLELMTIDGGVHMWYVSSDMRSSLYTLEWFDKFAPLSTP